MDGNNLLLFSAMASVLFFMMRYGGGYCGCGHHSRRKNHNAAHGKQPDNSN